MEEFGACIAHRAVARVRVPSFLVIAAFVAAWVLNASPVSAGSPPPLRWDDFNSHVWTVGIDKPADFTFVTREWISDEERAVFHLTYTPGAGATSGFLLAFTNLLAPEPFSDVTEIRFDLKWDTRPASAFLKVEGKKLTHPYAAPDESVMFSQTASVTSGGYQEYRIPVSAAGDLSRLIFVFDHIGSSASDIYLDNLRVVRNGEEYVWDTFDTPSRFWIPFGAWLSWAGPSANPALEMISNYDGFGGQSGALFLRWDTGPDGRGSQDTESAEIKTEGNTLEAIDDNRPPPGLNLDLSAYNRISSDVVCSNENTLGVFFGHFEEGSEHCSVSTNLQCVRHSDCPAGELCTAAVTGFITPGVKVAEPGVPQRISWNIPWPSGFPANDVDVVSFVVRDIKEEGRGTGELRIDNAVFSAVELPAPDTAHAVWNLNRFDGTNSGLTSLGGNFGSFSPSDDLTPKAIQVTPDVGISANTDSHPGSSLKLAIGLSQADFAGEFMSLFGDTGFLREYTLDLAQFSQIQFSLRPAGQNTKPIELKVEVKDDRDAFDYTAFRYVTVPPAPSDWTRLVLDADVTNGEQWFFNRFAPDPHHAKLLVLVAERFFNPSDEPGSGTSFAVNLDEIRLIHKTETPFVFPPTAGGGPDGLDPLLDYIEQKAWLHFDRWVVDGTGTNPDLLLFLDRSIFPDLASTAAAGFGLAASCAAHRHSWLSEEEATTRVLRTLRTYANGTMLNDPNASPEEVNGSIGLRGWFWHFLDRDGTRKTKQPDGTPLSDFQKSELSTVDTAIFLWGALTAKAYFGSSDASINPRGRNSRADEIAALVDQMYSRVDFRFFLRTSAPNANQLYRAWKRERVLNEKGPYAVPVPGYDEDTAGYFSGTPEGPGTWDYYTDEILMILLLGVYSPDPQFRLDPSVLQSFDRPSALFTSKAGETVGPLIHSFFGSGFTYFFLESFLKADARFLPLMGQNFFDNAALAGRASWLYGRDGGAVNAPTFAGNVFGLTAAEGRDGQYHGEWGSPPRDPRALGATDDGTIAVYGPASFIALWPDGFSDQRVRYRNPSVDALVTLFNEGRIFDESIGFGDAVNLAPDTSGMPFYNMATFGIDNGPMLMMIENERSGLFWRLDLLAPCVGDCDGDLQVSISELILGVNIALGNTMLSACPTFDRNGDGQVSIDELIGAVNAALNGCIPPVVLPTAMATDPAQAPEVPPSCITVSR